MPWKRMSLLCLLCCAALLFGCGGGSPQEPSTERTGADGGRREGPQDTPSKGRPEGSSEGDRAPHLDEAPDGPVQCPAQCVTDADCPVIHCETKTRCQAGRCQAPGSSCPASCRADSDCDVSACGTRRVCQAGVCAVPSGCGTCPAGQRCDPSSQRCVQCLTDNDCASGQRCDTSSHTCVTGPSQCQADSDCKSTPARPRCHTSFGACVQCTTNAHCPSWQLCFSDARACGTDRSCLQRLFTCIADPKGCSSDAGCPTGKHCDVPTKRCVDCVTDAHCPSGQRCDSQQQCRSVSSFCKADSDCPTGKRCLRSSARCVACLTGQDCPAGSLCSPTNECRSASSCQDSTDCGVTQICQVAQHSCIGCVADTDCAWDQRCDTQSQGCVACLSDSDCNSAYTKGKICTNMACVAGCRTSAHCPRDRPYCLLPSGQSTGTCAECSGAGLGQCPQGKRCNTSSGQCETPTSTSCQSPQDCVLGQYCDLTTKQCTAGCLTDRDCPSSARYCDATKKACVACANDANCNKGQICETKSATCIPGCRSNRDCGASAPVCDMTSQRCYQPCQSDTDCSRSSARLCDTTRKRCVGCRSDQDCGTYQGCRDERCATIPCQQDSDCRSDSYCRADTKSCYPGCRGDADCPKAGQICLNHGCRAGCRVDNDCAANASAPYCIDHYCRACRSNSDCTNGETCLAHGSCYKGCQLRGGDTFCRQRAGSSGTVKCNSTTGLCQQCLFDAHCNKGSSCIKGSCVETRISTLCSPCQADADCAPGSLCMGYPCDTKPKERVCAAACDASLPCPAGFRCASIVRQGKVSKQCVPLLYQNRCDGTFAGTCAGVNAHGTSCSPGSPTKSCGVQGLHDAVCSFLELQCLAFCKQDADCPARHKCSSCQDLGQAGFNECSQIPSTQSWRACVPDRAPSP